MQARKIYLSGGSTYIMSLPKKWVEKVGLKEGDTVFVMETQSSLIVELREKEEDNREIVIKTSRVETSEALEKLLISYYLIGYDTLKIILDHKEQLKYREVARHISEILIGVEIVEDTNEALTLEILLNERKLPTIKALRRIHMIVSSMLSELISVFKEGEKALAKDITIRENEVDRLYFLVVRQLKGAVRYSHLAEKLGISDPRDALGYRMVVKNFERVSDHCENISKTYLKLAENDIEDMREFAKILKLVSDAFQKASKSFFSLDMVAAQRVFYDMSEINAIHEKTLNKLFQSKIKANRAMLLKGIMDSLNRIASYSTDIAEIAINMSVDVPPK
ncbi:MAG TPA: phosphate uptake regulator PhoU [Euryarchaeota archaeon]|nr:phosphate uptake regulator PhoU [Euryarchaeota archaeon]